MLDEAFENIEKKSFVFENNVGKVVPESSHLLMLRDQTTLILARPSNTSLKDEEYLPLSVLNIIMFYSLGSRLYKIREEQGLFYSIFGGFAIDANTSNSLDYICTLLNSEDVDHAKSEILKELENVKTNGITQAELDDAKQIYLNSLINMFSDTPSATQVMVALKLFGRDFDYYKKIFARLESLTIDDLNLVASKYIKIDEFTTITVGK
jgi:zinc protease